MDKFSKCLHYIVYFCKADIYVEQISMNVQQFLTLVNQLPTVQTHPEVLNVFVDLVSKATELFVRTSMSVNRTPSVVFRMRLALIQLEVIHVCVKLAFFKLTQPMEQSLV